MDGRMESRKERMQLRPTSSSGMSFIGFSRRSKAEITAGAISSRDSRRLGRISSKKARPIQLRSSSSFITSAKLLLPQR